jgi:hypothetical protein
MIQSKDREFETLEKEVVQAAKTRMQNLSKFNQECE